MDMAQTMQNMQDIFSDFAEKVQEESLDIGNGR
jgi:hypothetical protein